MGKEDREEKERNASLVACEVEQSFDFKYLFHGAIPLFSDRKRRTKKGRIQASANLSNWSLYYVPILSGFDTLRPYRYPHCLH